MKAITTKYLPATDTRGSRISAFDEDGNRITIPYDCALSGEAVHRKAAVALCRKMGWSDNLIGGGVKGGYVFVFSDDDIRKKAVQFPDDSTDESGYERAKHIMEAITGDNGLLVSPEDQQWAMKKSLEALEACLGFGVTGADGEEAKL